jgi:hypothetical protein
MRIIDALRDREQASRLLSPSNPALITGTPQQMQEAIRERDRHQRIASIVNNQRLTEIPRNELNFEAMGGRVIEHVASPNGDFYFAFHGDPQFHRRRRGRVLRPRRRHPDHAPAALHFEMLCSGNHVQRVYAVKDGRGLVVALGASATRKDENRSTFDRLVSTVRWE